MGPFSTCAQRSRMQQNLAATPLVTQLLTSCKYWVPLRGLTMGLSSRPGRVHGGFVNATTWNPSFPACLNASTPLRPYHTGTGRRRLSNGERCVRVEQSGAQTKTTRPARRQRGNNADRDKPTPSPSSREGQRPNICRRLLTTHNGFVNACPGLSALC